MYFIMGKAMNIWAYFFILDVINGLTGNVHQESPPRMLLHPKSVEGFTIHTSVEMRCEAQGNGLKYYWKKDGQDYNLNGPNIIPIPGYGTFRFDKIKHEDAGIYQCFAENGYGKSMSTKATLTLAKLDKVFQRWVIDETILRHEGENVTIDCKAPYSYPPEVSNYTWKKYIDRHNQLAVVFSKDVFTNENHTLYFVNVQPHDSGEYFCEVTNHKIGGSAKSLRKRLNVIEGSEHQSKPEILSKPEGNKVVLAGSDVTLVCIFGGNPTPRVTWTGYGIHSKRKTLSNSNTNLTIKNVSLEDGGDYTCNGTNNLGTDIYKFTVIVHKKPMFESRQAQPQNQNIVKGGTAKVQCKTVAIPEAKVQWFKNTETINPNNLEANMALSENGEELTITNVSGSMVIQCNANNRHGYAFGEGTITVVESSITYTGIPVTQPIVAPSDAVRGPMISPCIIMLTIIFWSSDLISLNCKRATYTLL